MSDFCRGRIAQVRVPGCVSVSRGVRPCPGGVCVRVVSGMCARVVPGMCARVVPGVCARVPEVCVRVPVMCARVVPEVCVSVSSRVCGGFGGLVAGRRGIPKFTFWCLPAEG